MTYSKLRDSQGFYHLPTETGDLLGLVASGGISSINLVKLQTLLGEVSSLDLSIEHLDFLPEKKAAAILAAIELGRRLWSNPTPRLSIINSPEEAFKCFSEILRGKEREHFVVLFLDIQNRVLDKSVLSIGSWHEAIMPLHEMLRQALLKKSSRIIVAHNHPSGNNDPSTEDLNVTTKLLAACNFIGIDLLDHLIITDESYRSLRNTESQSLQWPAM
jgi:DNA repair protein RadC